MRARKLLFLLTEDWFFCSHFIDRAVAAKRAGFDVVVAANEQAHAAQIRAAGLRFVALSLERRSVNPLKELSLLLRIFRLYRREKPDIVHQVGAKPMLYGSTAAQLARVPTIVNAPVGMGYIFSSTDCLAKLLRPSVRLAYRVLSNPKNSRVVFENGDDLRSFVDWGAVRARDAVLIKGAGIDLEQFQPCPPPVGAPVVMLTARMLRDKGINEFVAAAHQLHEQGVKARFVLVGGPDPINPTSLTEAELNALNGKKSIEWWGWSDNMAEMLKQAHIVCLPSYREGLPKSLLEAAACGLPIVTTDTPGCREVVIDGINGFLVPVRNVPLLAEAMQKLIVDATLRERMGEASRAKAIAEFSAEKVACETLSVYLELIHHAEANF